MDLGRMSCTYIKCGKTRPCPSSKERKGKIPIRDHTHYVNGSGMCETCERICPTSFSWNIEELVNIPVL